MTEKITCKKCGSENYVTASSGPHLKASCADCGAYIKFISKPFDPDTIDLSKEIIHAGKHKGKSFAQVGAEEPDYIRWMAENMKGWLAKVANLAIEEMGI
jgi:uncharacterized Zn finger protein